MENKTIHYCWFGGNPKTKTILKCIDSWKKYFPDWEIKEWNEDNFDINCNTYVKQAYEAKKWAFVSDYCRFYVLEQYGGLYFDTDVEVVKSFDDLLNDEAFAGFETDEFVAPGLVMYVKNAGNEIIKQAINYYDNASYLDENGKCSEVTICVIFTEILKKYGFVANGKKQLCGDIVIYPKDYFCPFDDATGVLTKTENTHSIHWYDKTWMSKSKIIRNKITRILHRIFGKDIRQKINKILKR